MSLLTLGPLPVAVVAHATAFPREPIDTPSLLARLTPDLPPARRAALLAYVNDDVGVASRAFVAPGERALDLAIGAVRELFARSPEHASSIVAHVHATSTPSRWTGPEAARIGQALGLELPFFDVRSGCTGGLWALIQAARLALDAQAPVLVTAADAFSRSFSPGERMLPLAMGDGAVALVVAPGTIGRGITRAVFGGRPQHADLATVHAELPPDPTADPPAAYVLGGDPAAFSAAAEVALSDALRALAPPDDAHVIIQTGRAAIARRVHARADTTSLAQHGNIGAAAALVALVELAARSPEAARRVAIASAGGGLSFGALHASDLFAG